MRPPTVMLIAGEPSGDALAAELVCALREQCVEGGVRRLGEEEGRAGGTWVPEFFGAGGPRMAAAGVEVVVDMMPHSVVGVVEVLRELGKFRRLMATLLDLVVRRQPDVVVLVDYAGFNRRLAAAVQRWARGRRGPFANWRPKVVYFVSPQVWASRSGRVYQLARDIDLLLSIFPFEAGWYAQRVPGFPVRFVGHPMLDRYAAVRERLRRKPVEPQTPARVLLLPGSRLQEVRRHLGPMLEAVREMQAALPVAARLVFPDASLARYAAPALSGVPVACQVGGLAEALLESDLAIASSGTVTMECALFRVPTVVIYRVAWPTYWLAMQLVQIDHMAMPNLLAGRRVFPELLQGEVTAERVVREGLSLLMDPVRRRAVREGLDEVMGALGGPGACRRAASAVLELLSERRQA